jgi:predicted nucleic acid-binding protein
MNGVLVDSNVILDIFLDDPNWADWSETALADASQSSTLYINQIVYTEVSIAFEKSRNWNQPFIKADFSCWRFRKKRYS